jgi:hypothetical protein
MYSGRFQSKLDYEFDSEEFRNTYLATLPDMPFEQAAVDQVSREYLDRIMLSTLWTGVRNAGGTGAADLCSGWGTVIAAEITALALTPVVGGSITTANAVTRVEQIAEAAPLWMRERGFFILCSYNVFDKYKTHYRTLNSFGFNRTERGDAVIDGFNAVLRPVSFMGTSQRLVATIENNLVFGTDLERVSTYPTPHLNIMQIRHMMPVGCQIQDLGALVVNDQA